MTAWDDAYTAVSMQCQATVYPTLSDDELFALVDNAESYAVWSASTAYTAGALVAPTAPNGHLYRCLVGGTSGDTEPTWPLYSNPDDRIGLTEPYWGGYDSPIPGSSVIDGTTLLWIEAGVSDGHQYDVRLATYNGWMLKAAKATANYDGAIDRNQYRRSQVYQQCVDMAQRFAPMGIA